MDRIMQGLRSNPLLWLLAAVPAVFAGERLAPESHTMLFVANTGKSAWYVGVMLLVVYATFAMTLYLLPPASQVPS